MKPENSLVDVRLLFYKDCINEIIKNKNASILVIEGGENDKRVFQENGFINVTISNIDDRQSEGRLNSWFKIISISILSPIYRLIVKLFPKQQNLFAFIITKPVIPDDLQPWIKFDDGVMSFNESWAAERIKAGS